MYIYQVLVLEQDQNLENLIDQSTQATYPQHTTIYQYKEL